MNSLHDSLYLAPTTDKESSRLFNKKILQVQEVADLLGVSKGHIYNLTSRGEIPFYKKGKKGRLYFKVEEIFDWICEETV